MTIEDCLHLLVSLNSQKTKDFIAPHKGVLLLSVIDLVEEGRILRPVVVFDEILERKFLEVWRRYVGESAVYRPVVATPFYHMGNEPFWSVVSAGGGEIAHLQTTPSGAFLRRAGARAVLDEEMFALMKVPVYRARMRTVLVSAYCTTAGNVL